MPADDSLYLLKRLARHKGAHYATPPRMGDEMIAFFKKDVQRKLPKVDAISICWQKLIPATFLGHTCLDGFTRGTLTVLVDSASHLYELRQLMLAGIEKQLLVACRPQGLRKVQLKPGQWRDPRTGAPRF